MSTHRISPIVVDWIGTVLFAAVFLLGSALGILLGVTVVETVFPTELVWVCYLGECWMGDTLVPGARELGGSFVLVFGVVGMAGGFYAGWWVHTAVTERFLPKG